ncbi:hypothetical protein [Maridesulfovibrio zosterae]|uniref:hypothetical protein n=1 Tax=Maridesulfovibrio zosterae TaxID=82171 RepID=UPI0004207A1C|nr:hypothetical protein [Maridesulfovibrio zosterae]
MCSDLDIGKDFFHFFAMFEYALKTNGFCQTNKNKIITGADWEGFAAANPHLFDNRTNTHTKESVDYLINQPPKKQALSEKGMIKWIDPPLYNDVGDHIKITRYIRQVRNNLFHGGKFKGNYFSAQERSRYLISHSTIIMQHVIANHSEMNAAFEGADNSIRF